MGENHVYLNGRVVPAGEARIDASDAARKRYGPALLDPGAMPDANVNLDDLP
jgi:hypothetical protein